jgi:hypothetical protein
MEEVSDAVDRPVLASIREEWQWVRPALEEILHRDPDVDLYPEDVYAACSNGEAQLWTVAKGMFITKFSYGAYNNEKILELWFSWSGEKGSGIGAGVHKLIEGFAKANGCVAIETSTPHQQLINYLCDDLNYRVTTQYLRKDLE